MLKMIIYVDEKGILPINKYEYRGNKEIGKILGMISESLLKYQKEEPNYPTINYWYGQKLNKIEIMGE